MSETIGWLSDWEMSAAKICHRIKRSYGVLKIILKTKNETQLLRRWIEHHAKIVGFENLIIFDNGSTSQEIEDIYLEYHERVIVARYRGFVDNIHQTTIFHELYASLRDSCGFFTFLDTDEYLTLIQGDNINYDSRIVDFLRDGCPGQIFPGTWLQNVIGCDNQFWLNAQELIGGMGWGKPIISSTAPVAGLINHNIQIDRALFSERMITNFFVLHMNRLFPQQRIRANFHKLVAHGVLTDDNTIATALELPLATVPEGNIRTYLKEIRDLSALVLSGLPVYDQILEGAVQFNSEGKISFYNVMQRDLLDGYLDDPATFSAQVFDAQGQK